MKFKKIIFVAALGFAFLLSNVHEQNISYRLLANDERYEVFINETIKVENRSIEYNGESKTVSGQIITPSGYSYSGKEFTTSESGLYQVVYTAYFGHHEEKRVVEYLCQKRGRDLFEIDDSTSISFGLYRYNTKNYFHQGVIFDVKNGSEIKFKDPLDVNDFLVPQHIDAGCGFKDRSYEQGATAASVIDFMVDPSNFMETDFTSLTIKLTDSVNPKNYVEIRVSDAGLADARSGSMSYVRAGAYNNWFAGWEWNSPVDGKNNLGKFHLNESGSGLSMSFRGQPYNDNLFSGQILYCSAEQRLYNYRGSLETNHTYFINDLDDPFLYGNKIWEGFTSGKFYVSVTPNTFSNSSGRIIIKSVGKYDLTEDILEDKIAPTISVDLGGYTSKTLAKAPLNSYYPIFPCVVNDNYDSNLEAKISVTYRDTVHYQDIDVSIENNRFFVSKSGTYTIKYNAKDKSGNSANQISYKITTIDSVDDVNLQLEETSQEINVYESTTIPSIGDITATGGTGKIDITRTIYNPNNEIISLSNNNITPTLVGDYRVVFKGTDYVGNEDELVYTLSVKSLSKPVFIEEPNLPPVLIEGFSYSFENIRAIETINNEVVEITPTIQVDGVVLNNKAKATGDNMKVEFIAKGSTGISIYERNIPVVNVIGDSGIIDQSKYFVGDFITTENVDDVTLNTSSDASALFANVLDGQELSIAFRKVSEKTNYQYINVTLIDATNQNIKVTLSIDILHGNRDSSGNLASYLIAIPGLSEASFEFYNQQIGLTYKNDSFTILDTTQNEVGTILIDDNGNKFNGFPKGMYLEISLGNVTQESEIKVEKVCNQSIGYKYGNGDMISPSIALNGVFIGEQYIGDQFYYPTFEAYDVLSEIETTSIRIGCPDGSIIAGDSHMTDTFTIKEYGQYSVIYQAVDTAGNPIRVIKSVHVYDDNKPTLTVDPLPRSEYKVGATIEIPKYKVSDNGDKVYVDVILIMPTNEMRILTHDDNGVITSALDLELELYNPSFIASKTAFRLEMAGNYRLRFVAYDSSYNTVMVEYAFTAK